ncbi:MAG: hypothetical protein LBR70_04050 [Lactobacillaceae bacterium]|jgi:hypothetical protein|nr:hypothetical protein [Lactobacillaceae bacterium]
MKFKDEDLKPSSGIGSLIHAITWPIRKFYIIVPVLALLLATPIFFGVKVTEMPEWYKEKTSEMWGKTPGFFTGAWNKTKGLLGFDTEKDYPLAAKSKSVNKADAAKRGIDQLVDAPKRRTSATERRKGFNVSDNDIPRIAIKVESGEIIEMAEVEDIVVYSETPAAVSEAPGSDNTASKTNAAIAAFVIKPSAQSLPLVYLKTPKSISGTAVVKNANEIEIEGVYIVLYGIYSKPNTLQNAQARAYLEIQARKNPLNCSIVAYTYQNVATAVCFSGEENINQTLVDKEYSQNIALPK